MGGGGGAAQGGDIGAGDGSRGGQTEGGWGCPDEGVEGRSVGGPAACGGTADQGPQEDGGQTFRGRTTAVVRGMRAWGRYNGGRGGIRDGIIIGGRSAERGQQVGQRVGEEKFRREDQWNWRGCGSRRQCLRWRKWCQLGHRAGWWRFWGWQMRERQKRWIWGKKVAWDRWDRSGGRGGRDRGGYIIGGWEQGSVPPAKCSGVFLRIWRFWPTRKWREVPVWGRCTGATTAANGWRDEKEIPGGTDTQLRMAEACSGGGGGGRKKGSWCKWWGSEKNRW